MMFADTFFYLALLNKDDRAHTPALEFSKSGSVDILTTEYVLTEVGDALCFSPHRLKFRFLMEQLTSSASHVIVDASHELFVKGTELYYKRPDKDWSLTDCISFVVMEDHSITDALTGDHHFTQAGFRILFPDTP
ncbi:MAG TPA: hypothetical protein VEK08_14920 [Planctomycetota bacterium]|nr:hypothetical protein [Planctomycetota bacterium]